MDDLENGTGIYIRAEIDGKWESVDIADPRLPEDQLVRWLRGGTAPERELAVRVCLILLGRDQDAVERVPDAV